jgi:hypothetical protein
MSDLIPHNPVEYSKLLAASNLLPKAYQNQPANILVAIEYGRALGLAPMAAIQGINVINGKPTASASLIASLVRMAGHRLRVVATGTEATCQIQRSDDPDFTFSSTWNMDRAKQAGLTGNPSWQKYPEAMMKARAITECARDACPEVLAGVQYTAEELEPTGNWTAEPVQAPQKPVEDAWTLPQPPDDIVVGEVVEEVPEPQEWAAIIQEAEETLPKAGQSKGGANRYTNFQAPTEKQLKLLENKLDKLQLELGITLDNPKRLAMIAQTLGKPINTWAELSKFDVSQMIDHILKDTEVWAAVYSKAYES